MFININQIRMQFGCEKGHEEVFRNTGTTVFKISSLCFDWNATMLSAVDESYWITGHVIRRSLQ